jgi:hypothetical protein
VTGWQAVPEGVQQSKVLCSAVLGRMHGYTGALVKLN